MSTQMAFTRVSNGIRSCGIDDPRTIASDGPSITTPMTTTTTTITSQNKSNCNVTFVLKFLLTGSDEARLNPRQISHAKKSIEAGHYEE